MDQPAASQHPARRLIPLATFLFTSGASGYGFFSFAPRLLDGFISEGAVTLVLLFQPAVIMLLSPVFGRISDKKHGRKRLVTIGFSMHLSTYLVLQLLVWSGTAALHWFIVLYVVRGLAIATMACEAAWFTDHTFKQDGLPAGKRNGHTGISYYFFLTSVAWAVGSVVVGIMIEAFGIDYIGIICLCISAPGAIPLALAPDAYAKSHKAGKDRPITTFSIKQDLKALDQGVLIYTSIALRHFGLITALAIIAIVLQDIGVPSAVSGTVIALNPLFQIVGMSLATTAIVKGARPLRLLSGGITCSTLVVLSYTLGVAFTNGLLVAVGQSLVGFAWPFLIIGFEEHVTRNVDWFKRANYTSLRETFMNLGKVSGMLVYFVSFEFLHVDRLGIFTFLVFFPLTGLVLSLVANVRSGKSSPALVRT